MERSIGTSVSRALAIDSLFTSFLSSLYLYMYIALFSFASIKFSRFAEIFCRKSNKNNKLRILLGSFCPCDCKQHLIHTCVALEANEFSCSLQSQVILFPDAECPILPASVASLRGRRHTQTDTYFLLSSSLEYFVDSLAKRRSKEKRRIREMLSTRETIARLCIRMATESPWRRKNWKKKLRKLHCSLSLSLRVTNSLLGFIFFASLSLCLILNDVSRVVLYVTSHSHSWIQ